METVEGKTERQKWTNKYSIKSVLRESSIVISTNSYDSGSFKEQ